MAEINSELENLSQLYNQGSYQECIKAFTSLQVKLENDIPSLQALERYIALKLRSYFQLNEVDKVETELQSTLDKYNDNIEMQAIILLILDKFELMPFLSLLKVNSRFLAGMQGDYAFSQQQFDIAAEAFERFEAYEPDEKEYGMKFTDSTKQVFNINAEHIKSYHVNSLPNDNIYIEFEIETETLKLTGNIPGNGNDSICESGQIKIESDQGQEDFEINRFDVSLKKLWGPYHLVASGAFGEIHIYNTHLTGKRT